MKFHGIYDKLIPIEDLKPNPNNNNMHSNDQIKRLVKIIKYNGWRSPIIVSNRSGYIVKGHARYEAAKKLKLKEVPVIYHDYDSDEKEYADMTADNEIARWSDLDMDAVINKLGDMPDFDTEVLGIKKFVVEDPEKETSVKDILDEEQYLILIECSDELEQQDLFQEFQTREIKCKLMS